MENYSRLVAKIAIKYWQALPRQTKAWVEVDDFINDGLLFARFELLPHYDFTRTKFTTYLYKGLSRYFGSKLLELKRQKRTVVLEYQPPIIFVPNREIQMAGEQALKSLYASASPMLQKYMKSWFFNEKGPARVRMGAGFTKAKKEFKKLAPVYGVDYTLCKAVFDARRASYL